MQKAKNYYQKLIPILIVFLLLPAQATANNGNNTAIGVGIGALIGGLLIGAMSHSQAQNPPPVHVKVYSLQERAEWGDVDAQMRLASNYENQQNEVEALKWYFKAASKGNNFAQEKVAYMYSQGIGTIKDDQKALAWYAKAAEQGNQEAIEALRQYALRDNVYAQIELGYLYLNGLGVPQNGKEALNWYQEAANQGNAVAQNILGVMYENGNGAVRDYISAFRWFKYSARQGNANAQYNLGRMYLSNKATSIDRVKAYMWLNLAAAQGNTEAAQLLSTLEDSLSPREIEKGQSAAKNFLPRPPYNKGEMNFWNTVDDIGAFILDYYALILSVLAVLALSFSYKPVLIRFRHAQKKLQNFLLNPMRR